jgi:hypothetical protein
MAADDDYFVAIRETLVGRKAGVSASEKARQLRTGSPIRRFLGRVTGSGAPDRNCRKGAHGEALVGWLLARLPEGWHVFNDIPIGERGANIDHLVVGPAGVFTINTKNLTGRVWVAPRVLLHNGVKTNYLPKAGHEARRASRLLSSAARRRVEVRPVLAIIADEWTIKEKPTDVCVGTPRGVKKWLLSLPSALSASEVREIAGAAAKPSTWHRAGPSAGDRCECGGEVVIRTRRSDRSRFLGCSRFPACRRTWPVP